MAITVYMMRYGGLPLDWAIWGQVTVWPGQTTLLGSGDGPFFNITGVHNGANFQDVTVRHKGGIFSCGPNLDLTIKVDEASKLSMGILNKIPKYPHSLISKTYCRGQFFWSVSGLPDIWKIKPNHSDF
jgi:hypothetical protein